MTPLDKARDAMAAVEKATAGEWYQPDGANGHIWNNDAEPGEGYTPDRVIFEGPIQPQWAKDRKPDEWYGENERNLTAAAAAVNFVRDGLPALIAAQEGEVARLRGCLRELEAAGRIGAGMSVDDGEAFAMIEERARAALAGGK